VTVSIGLLGRLCFDETIRRHAEAFFGGAAPRCLRSNGWRLDGFARAAAGPSGRQSSARGRARGASGVAPAEAEPEDPGYALDEGYAESLDEDLPEAIGPVHYYGASLAEGVPILEEPGGPEAERMMPGFVVAAELASNGTARLLDGRGWITLGPGVEEVHPWAARLMKEPGIAKDDAASLAYLSLDAEDLSPLAEHLPLPQRVIGELERRGIATASPIQEAVFDRILRGESLCLQSQTGSGKTLAMMLPLLTSMAEESMWGKQGDKIIVVTSNRELAVQLFSDINSMGFFPPDRGYATLLIVGNIPHREALLNANIIIGTVNELGGVLQKDNDIITQMVTKLRAIVLDEVDDYTTAPKMYGSSWQIKRRRRLYSEAKRTLRLKDESGKIEIFLQRALAGSRRKDLQVLAASATLSRPMARKVYRLLRWDPLGRWYNKPPQLLRPAAAMKADWQAIPRMPTVSLQIDHRYVPVAKAESDASFGDTHWARKSYGDGGAVRLKVRAASGHRRSMGMKTGRAMSRELAASLLDGLHDALKSRGQGSSMLILSASAGITVRDAVKQLHAWGFHEAEAAHTTLWEDPEDFPSQWAIKYTYDQKDHSLELAERHRVMSERLRQGEEPPLPVASPEWRELQARKEAGEATSPIIVGYEGFGRGIHLDGVETVYVLGLPSKPATYLHMAGRVGRLGQRRGKVVSIVSQNGVKVLDSWRSQIGPGVEFREEKVRRIRSSARRQRVGLSLPPGRREEEEAWEELDEDVPLLAPAKDYVPVPGSEPGSKAEKEKEPEEIEWERERGRDQRAARRAALQLSRVTNPV